ncbi:MAG TPA: 3-methyl-2-oxobutanoate hydroxymethyltransferase [Vicinamibacterales bacterium]|jgi:3-methyl-2-oxobutanoate hydroxymethyltransferase|nr:3-methyl-2-oxobutanoate hydroxymethyltransferase [Vicinamibacterales bacterium]
MDTKPVRVTDFREKKRRGEKIAILTAYDATMAALLDRSGVDALLVGDSVGMVVLGHDSTLPVTLPDMIHHTAAVVRGTRRALVIADMPFMTYQAGLDEAVRNAGRLIQEGGAAAVKLEGGRPVLEVVRRLVDIGVPVMGHLGLQPQSVNQLGGYRKRGADREEADEIVADAEALQMAGAFALVMESVPAELGARATRALDIPVIGIGAGADCDGQVLVINDMLGLTTGHVPSFAKQYSQLADTIGQAVTQYVDDVRAGRFPQASTAAGQTVK